VASISAAVLAEELVYHQTVAFFLGQRIGSQEFLVEPAERGQLKQALIKVGYPVEDPAGYREGEHLEIILRTETRWGLSFRLLDYQWEAAETFYAAGTARGGSGVIVMPWGAGKTIVGLACMARLQTYTLVLQDTVEQDFALKRQLFLCEQGYQYEIHDIEQMRQKELAERRCPKLPFPKNNGANE
jgi:DNA excision repair protein ERCC-3